MQEEIQKKSEKNAKEHLHFSGGNSILDVNTVPQVPQENRAYGHQPVLLRECVENLCIRPDGIYVDGTLGRAGHAQEIVRRLTVGRLYGIDRDQSAIDAGKTRLAPWGDRVCLLRGNFEELDMLLDSVGVSGVDGMLFDLGVSSPQLDDPARGFSYRQDAPLDMRMDQDGSLTARILVNEWPQDELRRILTEYGEERYAPAIAAAIVRARERAPLETTFQLAAIVRAAMPAAALREKQHPAKRTFQAIRIAVNGELEALERMIGQAVSRLNPGGRLCVITFHSLEDRIVKRGFAERVRGCICPPDFPVCVCGKRPQIRLVSRKPVLPAEREIRENPRARSAKLRVAEKLGVNQS